MPHFIPKLLVIGGLLASAPSSAQISGNYNDRNPASVGFVYRLFDSIEQEFTLSIGDLYQGGIVIYLDDTRRHGLAISLVEQGDTYNAEGTPYSYGTGVGAGAINTANLLASDNASSNPGAAAAVANTVAVQANGTSSCEATSANPPADSCFGGWYLGSVYELQLISFNFDIINAAIRAYGGTEITAARNYWSSTYNVSQGNEAYTVDLSTGVATFEDSVDDYYVRAIRQF